MKTQGDMTHLATEHCFLSLNIVYIRTGIAIIVKPQEYEEILGATWNKTALIIPMRSS